jgi:hypothetical protein
LSLQYVCVVTLRLTRPESIDFEDRREEFPKFLAKIPRNPLASLLIHDIHDGSFLTDPSNVIGTRQWIDEDGINILGTPMGSPDFIESYLFGKGIKHR